MSLSSPDSAQHQSPLNVIQPQPRPFTAQVGTVSLSGQSYVILQLFTESGLSITYLSAEQARSLGEALSRLSREAATGLTLPTSLTGL